MSDLINEFADLGDDIKSVLSKPEVLDRLAGILEKREAPLRTKRDELLAKVSETNEVIKSLGGLDSIKSLHGQAEDARRKAEEAAAKSGDVEAIKKQFQDKLSERDTRIAELNGLIVNRDVEAELSKAIREAKGVPELLTPHLSARIKAELVDGKVTIKVLGANGVQMLRDDGKDATIKDLVAEFKSSAVFARAFEAENNGGSGAKGSNGLNGVSNPWMKGATNLSEQMNIARENPTLAVQLAAQAGVTLKL